MINAAHFVLALPVINEKADVTEAKDFVGDNPTDVTEVADAWLVR